MQSANPRLVDAEGGSRHLHGAVSARLLKQLAREGRVPAIKPGNKWLFDPERLDRWVETEFDAAMKPQKPPRKSARLADVDAWLRNGKEVSR